jgi:hypothetical protein
MPLKEICKGTNSIGEEFIALVFEDYDIPNNEETGTV